MDLIERNVRTPNFDRLFEDIKAFSPQLQFIGLGLIGRANDRMYLCEGFVQWSRVNRNLFVPTKGGTNAQL